MAFTNGWVRLRLHDCVGADPEARWLEVQGAHRILLFTPGLTGGSTVGVLTGSDRPSRPDAQMFRLPPGSTRARAIVLAPWPSATPPIRISHLRLTRVASEGQARTPVNAAGRRVSGTPPGASGPR